MSPVRGTCRDLLPEPRIKRHLFWRFLIVWQKPAAPKQKG